MSIRRIAYLTPRPPEGPETGRIELGATTVEWDVIRVNLDLPTLRQLIEESLKRYDAVALGGLKATCRLDNQIIRHPRLWKELALSQWGNRFSDGTALQNVLGVYLARQAARQLGDDLREARVLCFSGITHFGVAEVLRQYTKHINFGDMVYGFRFGIPIRGLRAFKASVPKLVSAIRRAPLDAFWKAAQRKVTLMPKFRFLLRRADVIIGDFPFFQRFAPKNLEGKIIFSTLYSEEDAEFFARRQAQCVVSLTPVVDGSYVPLSVLESVLRFDCETADYADIEDYFVARLRELNIEPRIINLAGEVEQDHALAALPAMEPELMPAEDEVKVELSGDTAIHKFCFVIHPLTFNQATRLQLVKAAHKIMPERLIEDAMAHVKPFPVGMIRGLASPTGARAEGMLYAVPMTSRAIMRYPPEFLYKRLRQVAEAASAHGCRLMGLGAFTSVVGDAGVTVSRQVEIGVTTGNSFTVAATLITLQQAAERCGIDIQQGKLLIVGATGSIGSICARMAASRVGELFLVSPRSERLLALARQLERENPGSKGRIKVSRHVDEFVGEVDGIITTTSSTTPVIDIKQLRPGCLVLDVARPPDITAESAAERNDVLVVESGEVLLPAGAELTYNIGLPEGVIYACLAETILLALDGRMGHYTLGREIEPDKVNQIAAIAARHDFQLAPIRSFGQPVSAEHFERIAAINQPRFGRVSGTA